MLQIAIYRLIFDKNLGKIAVITNLSTKRNVHISRGWFGLHSTYYTIYYRQLREKVILYFALEKVDNLVKNGRLSKLAAAAVGLLICVW